MIDPENWRLLMRQQVAYNGDACRAGSNDESFVLLSQLGAKTGGELGDASSAGRIPSEFSNPSDGKRDTAIR